MIQRYKAVFIFLTRMSVNSHGLEQRKSRSYELTKHVRQGMRQHGLVPTVGNEKQVPGHVHHNSFKIILWVELYLPQKLSWSPNSSQTMTLFGLWSLYTELAKLRWGHKGSMVMRGGHMEAPRQTWWGYLWEEKKHRDTRRRPCEDRGLESSIDAPMDRNTRYCWQISRS